MNTPDLCPRCGARRPEGGALSGLCPACMLRGGLRESPVFVATGGNSARSSRQETPDLAGVQANFPQLEVLGIVGRGGMGIVYKARQPRLDRLVALKVLAPDLASQAAFAERFLREAQALARLNHPNVVSVYDFGERNGTYFLLMEYVEGTHLRDLLESGRLRPEDALRLVPEICAGLQYAHEEGIVHRDIKPENILIDRNGRAKIADFGLVRMLGQDGQDEGDWRLTRASQVMGTPQYMAPEQLNRPRDVDHRADIYSLGVVLYEMLTSELPVGRFALPSERVHVDVRLDDVVLKALQREPDHRYQHASDLGRRVEDISREPNGTHEAERRGGWPEGRRIPFKNSDRLDGLVEIHGLVGLEGDDLVLEFRRKPLVRLRSPKVEDLRIPLSRISSIEYKQNWFRSQIRITTNRLKVAEALPEIRQGTFRLCFARREREVAERLARHLSHRLEV